MCLLKGYLIICLNEVNSGQARKGRLQVTGLVMRKRMRFIKLPGTTNAKIASTIKQQNIEQSRTCCTLLRSEQNVQECDASKAS